MAAVGTTTAQLAALLHKSIDQRIKLFKSDNMPNEGQQLLGGNTIKDTQAYIVMQQTTRPNIPQFRNELQPFPESAYGLGATKNYTNNKFGLLLRWSREVLRDMQYPEATFGSYASDLIDLCHQVIDQGIVNQFFNGAFSNLAPDGVAYIGNHPLEKEAVEFTDTGTAFYNNEIPNDPLFSTKALNDGHDILKRQRDSKGQIMGALGPVYVECSSKREVLVRAVANPVNGYEPFTGDRNTGKDYAGMIAGVIGLTRAVHDDWFILRTANSKNQKRFMWMREAPNVTPMTYKQENDSYITNCSFRYMVDEFDWRGQVGSKCGA